jgi:hypothetical protein
MCIARDGNIAEAAGKVHVKNLLRLTMPQHIGSLVGHRAPIAPASPRASGAPDPPMPSRAAGTFV